MLLRATRSGAVAMPSAARTVVWPPNSADGGSGVSCCRCPAASFVFGGMLLLVLPGCGPPSGEPAGTIEVKRDTQELSLSALFHRENAETGTWHLLVHERGDMASLAYFTTDVTPRAFYDALRVIGLEAEDAVSCTTMGERDVATAGDALEFLFTWDRGAKQLPLNELLIEVLPPGSEAGRRGLEMRFGGNHTGDDAVDPPAHRSGCLACLYSCCAGVTSNSRANLALLRSERNWHRYRINPRVDLADGTRVSITVRSKSPVSTRSPDE